MDLDYVGTVVSAILAIWFVESIIIAVDLLCPEKIKKNANKEREKGVTIRNPNPGINTGCGVYKTFFILLSLHQDEMRVETWEDTLCGNARGSHLSPMGHLS